MLNQDQNKLKIFRDDIGNLVIETANEAFVAIPLDKNLTATAASAANSIAKGSAILNHTNIFKRETNKKVKDIFLSNSAIPAVGTTIIGASLIGGLIGIAPVVNAIVGGTAIIASAVTQTSNKTTFKKLSPSSFLMQITKSLSFVGYVYFQLEQGNQEKEILAPYVAVRAIKVSKKRQIYKLSYNENASQENRFVFYKVIASFQESSQWNIVQNKLGETEDYSFFIVANNKNIPSDKIKSNKLVNNTFEKALQGDYSE